MNMWFYLSILSALLLGFYDVAKKKALTENAVLPVLWLNTLISSLLFLPVILSAATGAGWFEGTILDAGTGDGRAHGLVIGKAFIVLTSWVTGYYGLKHLPITIVGPINATRPVMVLVGALILFGERLNGFQWAGVAIAVVSLWMLSRSSRREGIRFTHNHWVLLVAVAAVTGAASGLYDKYIMRSLDPVFVQSWYNLYQLAIMTAAAGWMWWPHRRQDIFRWRWSIPLISIFLSAADFAYFYALSDEGAMISVVSMVRRGSALVSFTFGALLLHEKNLRAKALDLGLILVSMILLWIGSR